MPPNSPLDKSACGAWALALLISIPGFAQEAKRLPCAPDDKPCAISLLRDHAAHKIDFWRDALRRPLAQRIGAAPPALLEYVALDNIVGGFSNRPRAPVLSAGFIRDVRDAFAELPSSVKTLLESKLAGIFFVDDLGGTGYTDAIVDAEGKQVAGFVVLDATLLSKFTANAWATWKENTPFVAEPATRLRAIIETGARDNRKNAIQYILLHELGHVISIGANLHPPWGLAPAEVSLSETYRFYQLAWSVLRSENRFVTRFDVGFPERREVVYYLGAKLRAGQMSQVYSNLERTNFVSLYGATNPADDFAEAFASYVHVVLMRRPFEIRIERDGKLFKTFSSCWDQPRCGEKKSQLEALLSVR